MIVLGEWRASCKQLDGVELIGHSTRIGTPAMWLRESLAHH
ncbi:MAG TPA: hypothetical protein VMJ35_01305 [Dongiaceae bacterium]|nr:hypothetical protein [Dongiaceae bacterium]